MICIRRPLKLCLIFNFYNMRNFVYALILPLLFSCSSDDDNNVEPNVSEGIVKIEVSTTAVDNNFEEALNIQVVGNAIDKTTVSGATWDEVQQPHNTTKWFFVQHDVKNTAVYETSNKVTSVTYASVISPKEDVTTPLQATVKFYVDGKLKHTESFTAGDEVKQVSLPFVVAK